jgi:NADPH2:quinone reductase
MRAAWFEKKGPARDVLNISEQTTPVPGPGEVLVAVRASGINPSDTKGRGGARGNLAMSFPRIIPHHDGAGLIASVGAGVPEGRVGERVWVYEAQLGRPNGTAADFVSIPAAQAVPMPDRMSFAEGACLGVPALTAHRCVFADGPVDGQTVLVTGGAGAVGFYAVQFARQGGARVIATVSGDRQAEIARAAGAHLAINRRTEDVVACAAAFAGSAAERSVDRVVEVAFGANLPTALRMLRSNGVVAAYSSDEVPEPVLPFWPLVLLDATVRFVLVYAMTGDAHRQAIDYVSAAASEGWLQHNIARSFPLEAIAEAHELVDRGAGGKVILELGA